MLPARPPAQAQGADLRNRFHAGAFRKPDLQFLDALSHYAYLALLSAEEQRQVAAERELADARIESLREEIAAKHEIIGRSVPVVACYELACRAARGDVPVLICGETGTGKEVFARLIHARSPRAGGPFVAVNLAGLPATLVESELFGHEKGAFTGAERKRIGRFELASGGTLFLDEVLDTPLEVQAKLLRVLEQRTFERLGSNEPVRADVRVICACNRSPEAAVADGRFREDLFYRVNGIRIDVPPLRERPDDAAVLARHFLQECGPGKAFEEEALACLANHPWPGNVRQLRNLVEALNVLVDGPLVRVGDLPPWVRQREALPRRPGTFEPLAAVVERAEEAHFRRAMELAEGNSEKAIRLLGVSRAKFFERKKRYRL